MSGGVAYRGTSINSLQSIATDGAGFCARNTTQPPTTLRKANLVTLTQLAQQLELSASTISRALTRPEMVAPATLEKVLSAVEAAGYRPNAIARSLREGVTRTIGLLVSDIQNPFYSSVTKAIERVAAANGYSTIICNADEDPANEEAALKLLADLKVSGIIHGSSGSSQESLSKLRQSGIPIIDIDRATELEDADTVLVDNFRGSREAAEYLIDLGHRRIATIAGPVKLTTGRDRLEGYKAALRGAGVEVPTQYVEHGDFREESGRLAAERLLALPDSPTALFVANNEMMAGALATCRSYDVRIPEDLSLISFDDVRWARYVDPPLTVIAQPTELIGEVAATLLFERLAGRTELVSRVLETRLIKRGSCAAPTSPKGATP